MSEKWEKANLNVWEKTENMDTNNKRKLYPALEKALTSLTLSSSLTWKIFSPISLFLTSS